MKRKRYDEGGDVMEAANASEESQDIARSMGAGPKNEEAPKASKPRVVTKEELAKSGYDNLRDYLNAKQGKYHLVELNERYKGLQLPEMYCADLKREKRLKNMQSHFSSLLLDQMKRR